MIAPYKIMVFHLGIDAIGNHHSGGATILLGLLQAAIADDRFGKISVFCSPRTTRNFDLPHSDKIVEVEKHRVDRNYFNRIFWSERLIGRTCEKLGIDALFCMNGVGHAFAPIPHVTYMQQSIPFSSQAMKTCSWKFQQRMRLLRHLMRRSCRTSALVIAQTPTMQQWISEAFQLSSERIVYYLPPVYPLPQSTLTPNPALERIHAIPENSRLLYVGNLAPYKNLKLVTESMTVIRQQIPNATLFLTAPPDHRLCQAEGVVGLGYMSRADLYQAIKLATILIQPSLVESATLPAAEALLLGTPTLVSDLPYAHDMCEDAGTYFDPLDSADFADKALMLMRDPDRRLEVIQRGNKLMHDRLIYNSYRQLIDTIVQVAAIGSETK